MLGEGPGVQVWLPQGSNRFLRRLRRFGQVFSDLKEVTLKSTIREQKLMDMKHLEVPRLGEGQHGSVRNKAGWW